MIATPLLAILLQAAAPASAGSGGQALLPGDLPEVAAPMPILASEAFPEEVPLRFSATDAYGCLWGSSNVVYCRHPSSYESLDGARVGLPVSSFHSMLNPMVMGLGFQWTLWRSDTYCVATSTWGAFCYQGALWRSNPYDAFGILSWGDFEEQNVGFRDGQELRRRQEAMGTAPRWTSGGEAPHQQSGASAGSSGYQGTRSGGGGGGGGAASSGSSGGSVSKPGRMGLQ